jgi:hypothetical protein
MSRKGLLDLRRLRSGVEKWRVSVRIRREASLVCRQRVCNAARRRSEAFISDDSSSKVIGDLSA